MATIDKRPVSVPGRLPAALQRCYDKYSVAMQKYKDLLKQVAPKDHPPLAPLPSGRKKHDLSSLAKRIQSVNSRRAQVEFLTTKLALHHEKKKSAPLPPHLRVLQDPPVVRKSTVACVEERPLGLSSRNINIIQVCSACAVLPTNVLTSK
jgi:hypothetical protein